MDTIVSLFHQTTSFIIPFIVLLGVLIFVHELGHFSVAKFFGVRVEVFSLGFGRKILQKKYGDTVYCVSMIPFGGYVKMFGDDPSSEVPEDQKKYSFNHQPVLPRVGIVLAGPLMNAFFAFVLFVVISGVGEEFISAKLGDVPEGSSAYSMGFRTGDNIISVGGLQVDKWDTFKKSIEGNGGKSIDVQVQREKDKITIHATPATVANKNILSNELQVGDIEGLSYLSRSSAVGIADPTSVASRAGLRTGDLIRKIGNNEITKWTELVYFLIESANLGANTVNLQVDRAENQKPLLISLPVVKSNPLGGIESSDLFLSDVKQKSPAKAAGIESGDRLLRINKKVLKRWEDVIKLVQGYDSKQGPLEVEFNRQGKIHVANITPEILSQTDGAGAEVKNYALGVVTGLIFAPPETFVGREYSITSMVTRGLNEAVHWTKLTALSFVKLAQRKVSAKSIGGPLMIGKLASDTWRVGISPFLKIMAIISINLFLLNLLPVPMLDGGHLLFFSIEFVKGSPLSFRKMEVLQQVGMFLLFALMVFSMFNDILRFFTS